MSARITLPGAVVLAAVVLTAACHDAPTSLAPTDDALAASHVAQDVRAWFASAAPEVLALPGTVFADHDESANLLVFGVENQGVVRGVRNALTRRAIPATAYEIKVTEPIHFMSDNLRSEHRPVVSGIQLHWSQYVCTLGFSVDHAGGRSFITNSHCTDNQGTTGNTQYNQPSRTASPAPIGFEAHDPAYTRDDCSAGKVCRNSDAARVLYEPGVESQARIAKTTGLNSGSLVVNGHFSITGQDNSTTHFTTGTTMQKVGRTTGWTSGTVSNTCVRVNVSGSNIQLRCQTFVESNQQIVAGGDSGSPVFTGSSGVTLRGILWGGNSSGTLFVFSPFSAIRGELGDMDATKDGVGGDGGGSEPPPPDDDDGGSSCPPGHQRQGRC